jgi:hypothetical protein
MESPLIHDLETGLEAQRAELADQLSQFRESIRFKQVRKDFAEGAGLKAEALGTSVASVLMRHPVPLAIAGTLVVLLFARRYQPRQKSKELALRAGVGYVPDRQRSRRSVASRIANSMSETAGDVFGSWTASMSTSVERFAVELTREAAQALVRAGDAMIASGFERLAQSLSQIRKV